MPKRTYLVDWSDPPFPRIIVDDELGDRTFTECKEEIIEHFRALKAHANAIIRQTQTFKKENVLDQ